MRPLLGLSEIRRTLRGCGLRSARAVAQLVGARLCLLFGKATKAANCGVVVDREELSKAIHDVLDQEFDTISLKTRRRLYYDGEADYSVASELARISHKYQKNPSSTDNTIEAIKYIKDSLSFENSISNTVGKILSHITCDELCELMSYIQREKKAPKLPWDEPEENPCNIADKKRDAVMAVAQGIIAAKGIAYEHGYLDMSFSEATRREAHKVLNQLHPLPVPVESKASITPTDERVYGTVAPADLVTPLQEAFQGIAQSLGLDLPQPKPIGEAVEEYKESIRNNPKYKNGLDSTKRRTLDEIVLAFGKNTLTTELTPQLTERYCNLLHCLPKKTLLDNLRPDLWSYMTEKHNGPTIEDGTVRTRLINASDFFNELGRKNLIGEKLTKDICRPIRERIQTLENKLALEKTERPFEVEELRKLFNPTTYLNWSCLQAADFWGPLLGLFTGARMDELLTLRKKDIKCTPAQPTRSRNRDNSRDGICFIDLTDSAKKLKNTASHRVIPIHQHLIELGLLSFIDDFDDDEYLFANYLNKDNTGSSNKLTKAFTKYRRSLDIGRAENEGEGERLSFHTFRHTVITTMKHNHVPDSVSREISGHSAGGGKKDAHTQNYEQRHTIEKLYDDGIRVLDCYLEQVPKLHALKDSPWTKPAAQRGVIPKRRPRKKE